MKKSKSNYDNELLDSVAKGFALASERKLAARLGISPATLDKIRNKGGTLSWKQRFVVLDKIGFLHLKACIKAITPKSLSEKLDTFVQSQANQIAEAQLRNQFETPDLKIIQLLNQQAELVANSVFNRHFNLPQVRRIEIAEGAELTAKEREQLMLALSYIDEEKWNMPLADIFKCQSSSEDLLIQLKRVTSTSQEDDNEEKLIKSFKIAFGFKTDSELARALGIPNTKIHHAKKGHAPLPIEARLKMADLINKKSRSPDRTFDVDEVISLADSPARILELLNK